jgi:predicted homoserine dehydrogenase-like protein
MLLDTLLDGEGKPPVRAALCGVGEFGHTLLDQCRYIKQLGIVALCDLDVERVRKTLTVLDYDAGSIAVVDSRKKALTALETGKTVITEDASLLNQLDLDIFIEATGEPERGAENALSAIEAGMHVAVVNKEAASVVGPLLAHEAARAGVVFTLVDGDQPSLLVGLVSWARALGFEIAGAGKASEFDFVYDAEKAEIVTVYGNADAENFGALWNAAPGDLPDVLAKRSAIAAVIPQRTAPDYCELGLVANCTGLMPDRPDLHAPIARTVEVAELFRIAADGGIFASGGQLDVFNCLRRPDEISFAGGVFVVVRINSQRSSELLLSKGFCLSHDGKHALIYNPIHALGLEAPISLLSAVRRGWATAGTRFEPVCDMICAADQELPAGAVLTLGERHTIAGSRAQLTNATTTLTDDAAVPYYLAAGARLIRPVRPGAIITCGDLDPAARTGQLWNLRQRQDWLFSRNF